MALARLPAEAAESLALPGHLDAEATAAQRVEFSSGPLVLWGEVWRPPGVGPFPAVLWNHGSVGRQRGLTSPRANGRSALDAWLSMDLAVFAPSRRGYDGSPGETLEAALAGTAYRSPEQGRRLVPRLLAETEDVLAAASFLRTQPWIDPQRIICSGYSLGAITTVLALSQSRLFAACVPFALGAILWQDHAAIRELLLTHMAEVADPVMILQAENDYSTAPTPALAAILERRGLEHRAVIYPATGEGPEQGHLFCSLGATVWRSDVRDFLHTVGVLPAGDPAVRRCAAEVVGGA